MALLRLCFALMMMIIVQFCVAAPLPKETDESLAEMFRTFHNKIADLENQVHDLAGSNENLKQTVANMKGKLEQVEKKQAGQFDATADTIFLATISAESIAVSDDEPIIFDTAPINPGGHYNPVLGAYTAPYNGYYQFSAQKEGNNYASWFWLLIDEERYLFSGAFTDADASPSNAITINIELTAGQIVRIENDYSTFIYGTNSEGTIRSWFTGYMLYAL